MLYVSIESKGGRPLTAFEMALHARLLKMKTARFGPISAHTARHFVEVSCGSIHHESLGNLPDLFARTFCFHNPEAN
jgi:hypothetical protein